MRDPKPIPPDIASTRWARRLVATALLASLFGAPAMGCEIDRTPAVGSAAPAAAAHRQAPTEEGDDQRGPIEPAPLTVADHQQRGVCYAHNWQQGGRRGYGSETSEASLRELRDLGVNWISITPFGFQRSLESHEVRLIGSRAAETDARLVATIEHAHSLGLRVMMKPHIWINYSDWRGHIRPAGPDGWARWFASYEDFILHYARLSESAGADALVVGVELGSSTRRHPDRWRTLIGRVREVYHGPLIYAANWDEVADVAFWDALDFIGVQMFAPLTTSLHADEAELVAGANRYLTTYRAVSERFDRPVILTEVGFKSIAGTAISPMVWPEHLPREALDYSEQAQASAYRAIIRTFGQADFVAGMYWWKWFTDPETDEEGPMGFSPRGKRAEDLLRAAFRVESSATP